jgi:hypothetical protein
MSKSLLIIALAITVASAGSLLSNRAEAGGAVIKTLSNGVYAANVPHLRKSRHTQPATPPISEYSSSFGGKG